MKEPVDHIMRPRLPWRSPSEPGVTECGYDSTKVTTISRGDFLARLNDLGQRRTMMMTCVTCADTARRWGAWDDDPRNAVEREIAWESRWKPGHGQRLRHELLAIATLIELHKDEFLALLEEQVARAEWIKRKQK